MYAGNVLIVILLFNAGIYPMVRFLSKLFPKIIKLKLTVLPVFCNYILRQTFILQQPDEMLAGGKDRRIHKTISGSKALQNNHLPFSITGHRPPVSYYLKILSFKNAVLEVLLTAGNLPIFFEPVFC